MGEKEKRDGHRINIFTTPPKVLEFLVNGFHGLKLNEKERTKAGEILTKYDGIGLGMNAYGLYAVNFEDKERLHAVFEELDNNYDMWLKDLNDKILRFGIEMGSTMTIELFEKHFERLGYSQNNSSQVP